MIEVEPSETVRHVHSTRSQQSNATQCGADIFCSQVRQVKAKIAQEKGEYEAERMKVIYSGAYCSATAEEARMDCANYSQARFFRMTRPSSRTTFKKRTFWSACLQRYDTPSPLFTRD